MKRPFFIVIILFFCSIPSLQAQKPDSNQDSFFSRMDAKLYKQQRSGFIDTYYIEVPEYRWTLKSIASLQWNGFGVSRLVEGEGAVMQLASNPSFSQGFSVSWRNITIGAGFNPFQFSEKTRTPDQNYNISVYGNRMGMSAAIRITETLHGIVTALPDSLVTEIPIGNCSDISADFDAYYALFGDEFSFPAAFTQAQVQKRSAGSPLFTVSIRNGRTLLDRIEHLDNEPLTLWTNMLGLGAGYGHNFVTRHHWLLHVSTIGNLTVLKYNRIDTEGEKAVMRGTFPDFIGSAQTSATHWTGRFFYGFSATFRSALYGKLSTGLYNNSRLEAYLFFGIRL